MRQIRKKYEFDAEKSFQSKAELGTSPQSNDKEGEEEDKKKNEKGEEAELSWTLVIPEEDYAPTAIIRILRYMRRCALPASLRPLYQVGVPPLVRDQVHTMMACRLFGLHADAERLETVLLRQTISRGPLTMEDVECIWEEWGGVLRGTCIVDALVCYILYDVL